MIRSLSSDPAIAMSTPSYSLDDLASTCRTPSSIHIDPGSSQLTPKALCSRISPPDTAIVPCQLVAVPPPQAIRSCNVGLLDNDLSAAKALPEYCDAGTLNSQSRHSAATRLQPKGQPSDRSRVKLRIATRSASRISNYGPPCPLLPQSPVRTSCPHRTL